MPERPTGTVTFLFTDVEGSTRAWEEHPRDMGAALARHDALLTEAIEARNGYVFATGGDAFSAAFSDPLDAATAAIEAQEAMADAEWGPVGRLRVRMALHTGITEERDGDYFGPPLNRTSRIMSAASGGEVLTSETTAGLLRHLLPTDVSLLDLGDRKLRDLDGREHIFELRTGPPPKRPKRTLLIAAAAGAVVVAAGVVVGVSVLGGEETATTSSTSEPGAADDPRVWSVEIGPGLTTPVMAGGVVVTGQGSLLHALAVETGDPAWGPYNAFTAIEAAPATDGRRLFLTSGSRIIAIDAASGGELWDDGFSLQDASPAAVQGELVFVGASNEMYAYRVNSKERPWANRTFVRTAIEVRPAPAGPTIFVADELQQLYALGTDGNSQWQTSSVTEVRSPDPECNPAGQITSIVATQVLVPGRFSSQAVPWALTVDCQGYLKAWHVREGDSERGTDEWTVPPVPAPITGPPAMSGLTVYAMNGDGQLMFIDLASGLSNREIQLGRSVAAPVVDSTRGVVWVTGEAGTVWAVDQSSGEIEWEHDLGSGIELPVALAGELVIVADVEGLLTALRPPI